MKKNRTPDGPSLAELRLKASADDIGALLAAFAYVEESGQRVLASTKLINDEDREKLRGTVDSLVEAARTLLAALANAESGQAFNADLIAQAISKITLSAYTVGVSSAAFSVEGGKFRQDINAWNARAARKGRSSPKQAFLRAAVEAERHPGPVERPWKEADRILAEVNKRMEAGGHRPVTVSAIYRKLK